MEALQRMKIGELARRAGVTVQTVRYSERRGLLPGPPRRESGYHEYDSASLRAIELHT